LDPQDIKILSLGAIWNFGKGTGLSWVDIRLWGTKGHKVQVHRDHKDSNPLQIYQSEGLRNVLCPCCACFYESL